VNRDFAEFFRRATSGNDPFPYQVRLATAERLPALLQAPTGAGKTAAVVLAWLWRRRYADPCVRAATPRRLVYCLPMRVLVEQTVRNVRQWLQAVDCELIDWEAPPSTVANDAIGLAVAMGSEEPVDWDIYPDHDAIIVGTQDMLLSRALNRGYGMSRYRWPLHFGLLNNDCLWVHDEVQLMGDGLATSTQLAGLRRKLTTFGPLHEVWMSATMRRDWLASYDFEPTLPQLFEQGLTGDDLLAPELSSRLTAAKTLQLVDAETGSDFGLLSGLLLEQHRQGAVTLAVVNTVERAVRLYQAVKKLAGQRRRAGQSPESEAPQLLLLHSRFRSQDRERLMAALETAPPAAGRLIVSTQVVEAGVDLSSATLATDLAPWPSLVQRFGRCNRFGEHENAQVLVFDRDTAAKSAGQAAPYEAADLDRARAMLQHLGDGADLSPSALQTALAAVPALAAELFAFEPVYVLRRRDLLDLFDTTTDIAGNDIDVSRFVRDLDQTDVSVFWRDLREADEEKGPEGPRAATASGPLRLARSSVRCRFRNFASSSRSPESVRAGCTCGTTSLPPRATGKGAGWRSGRDRSSRGGRF
jgi:CRISPR-associated endonuclease/helicase Cas3